MWRFGESRQEPVVTEAHRTRSLTFAGICMVFGLILGGGLGTSVLLQCAFGILGIIAGFLAYAQIAKIFNFWPLHKADSEVELLTARDLRRVYRRFSRAVEQCGALAVAPVPTHMASASAHGTIRRVRAHSPLSVEFSSNGVVSESSSLHYRHR